MTAHRDWLEECYRETYSEAVDYSGIMEASWVIVTVLVGLGLAMSVHAQCPAPEEPNGTTRIGSSFSSYNESDIITYSCDSDVSGYFGAIYIRCLRNKDTLAYSWSNPDRNCDDPAPVGGGSISGICIAVANVAVAVIFIVYTKCCFHSKSDK